MPMPGARGGWHLRGSDTTYMWRLAKDLSLHPLADGAGMCTPHQGSKAL